MAANQNEKGESFKPMAFDDGYAFSLSARVCGVDYLNYYTPCILYTYTKYTFCISSYLYGGNSGIAFPSVWRLSGSVGENRSEISRSRCTIVSLSLASVNVIENSPKITSFVAIF